ncbi:hypothetical protein HELRODRAFT_164432 [Helobdella robusta]|uniref:Uncharacterized protein n=1 Tax=Helobdella robusta TaxID=6412 RepID=T1EVF0_HELRO|nr:hypothetical protein HELRODRAFT_164432 [Helobdella robusta]ESN94571.1 hypothetical protein HELRODRAFT_164432 [Helobdella robusta]
MASFHRLTAQSDGDEDECDEDYVINMTNMMNMVNVMNMVIMDKRGEHDEHDEHGERDEHGYNCEHLNYGELDQGSNLKSKDMNAGEDVAPLKNIQMYVTCCMMLTSQMTLTMLLMPAFDVMLLM